MAGSKTAKLACSARARCMAMMAWRTRSAASVSTPPWIVSPSVTRRPATWPSIRNGSSATPARRRISPIASRSPRPGRIQPKRSPSTRASVAPTVSVRRTRRAASSRSARSAPRGPSVALTSAKSSTSSTTTVSGSWVRCEVRMRLLQPVQEQLAVGQFGERVVGGAEGQFGLQAAPLGEVAGDPDRAGDRAGRVAHRREAHLERDLVAGDGVDDLLAGQRPQGRLAQRADGALALGQHVAHAGAVQAQPYQVDALAEGHPAVAVDGEKGDRRALEHRAQQRLVGPGGVVGAGPVERGGGETGQRQRDALLRGGHRDIGAPAQHQRPERALWGGERDEQHRLAVLGGGQRQARRRPALVLVDALDQQRAALGADVGVGDLAVVGLRAPSCGSLRVPTSARLTQRPSVRRRLRPP